MNNDKNQTLGGRLLQVRGARTQAEFAKELGISVPTYANYESGRRLPQGDLLRLLNEQYNVDLNWLVTGEARTEPGYQEFNERIFKRITATVVRLLREKGLLDEMSPDEFASALVLINHTVMSTLGPDPQLKDVDLEDLEGVVTFIAKKR
jgi:transcriptional regulator with XRE-family HTH domain